MSYKIHIDGDNSQVNVAINVTYNNWLEVTDGIMTWLDESLPKNFHFPEHSDEEITALKFIVFCSAVAEAYKDTFNKVIELQQSKSN